MPKSAWKSKRKTQRTIKRQAKRRQQQAARPVIETPRSQRIPASKTPSIFDFFSSTRKFDVASLRKVA